MQVASTAIYEMGPLETPEGGVDIDRIKRGITGVLHRIPRYGQKLAWIPLEGQPVWVDDGRFNLNYHLRHASLPRPGDDEQLRRRLGRSLNDLVLTIATAGCQDAADLSVRAASGQPGPGNRLVRRCKASQANGGSAP